MNNLVANGKLTRILAATSGGFGDVVVSDAIDMQGFDSVTFLVALGAIAATGAGTVKVQQSHDNAVGSFADLADTGVAVADADDGKLVAIEIVNPLERFVRIAVSRSTANVAIDSVVAIQGGAGVAPVTHDATTLAAALHLSPIEGPA